MDVIDVPSVDFSTVLLTSDFSEESDPALAYAKAIVRESGGELLLVNVAQLAPVLMVRVSTPKHAQCISPLYSVSMTRWHLPDLVAVQHKLLAMLIVVILVLIPWNTAW